MSGITGMATERYPLPASLRVSLAFVAVALLCVALGDLGVATGTPAAELARMGRGVLDPAWLPWRELLTATAQTLAYAVLAVSVAAGVGFALSLQFQRRWLRALCAGLRSVHELFWGLLFMQLVGIHPLAGLLAIALPYSGIFAKVYAELAEEHRPAARAALPPDSDRWSAFWYGHWPQLRPHLGAYTLYRLECGLRSSTILGFIGLPTLGFHLETAFMQGQYDVATGLIAVFFVLIASIRYWARPRLWPLYVLAAAWLLWEPLLSDVASALTIARDFIPAPLRGDQALAPWLTHLADQALRGAWNTLLVTQMALVLAGLIALLGWPLTSRQFTGPLRRTLGHAFWVALRAIPELILTFVFLLLWGPSMLPAVLALGLHNGAIASHLVARYSDSVPLRLDAPRGFGRYGFELLPRLYGQLLALLFYRWEIIFRESAILGVLGVPTLGFFIDSAFAGFHLDRALVLIAVSALINITIDQLARRLRRGLHLRTTPEARTPC